MNFIENESPRKLRGGFYTPPEIAHFLAAWALEKEPRRVLEPSCGDGAFLERVGRLDGRCEIVGWELDPGEAGKARERLPRDRKGKIDVRTGDFLEWFVRQGGENGGFGSVIGNPPFIRYQYLSEGQQALAAEIFARLKLPFTKHTNAWVPFVLASLCLTNPGGRLAMIIPSELLYIRHAEGLRQHLARACSRVLIIDPEELWFGDAQQGTVMLLAEKKQCPSDRDACVAIRPVRVRHDLPAAASEYFATLDFAPVEGSGKWTDLLLSPAERALLKGLRGQKRFAPLADLAQVDIGIVTGANKFFLVPDAIVDQFQLQPWAHPMFGRSEHVSGLVYDTADHDGNRRAGLPANFLWFDAAPASSFPALAGSYLAMGEQEGLHKRFKCRVREPWYRVPSVYATPVAMLKRAHHFPRLILNRRQAFTTDTAYRLKPTGASAESLVYGFLNSLTCLTAELEGRHYGGGVLELVPSEIERLLLPVCSAALPDVLAADQRFRAATRPEALLQERDQLILRPAGLSEEDCAIVHGAWDKMRKRRQRTSSGPEPAEVS